MYQQIKVFVMVATTGSISETARRLGYSQPAVTRQLQQLEKATGCQLLHRDCRPMRLTAGGRARLPLAIAAERSLRDFLGEKRVTGGGQDYPGSSRVGREAPPPLFDIGIMRTEHSSGLEQVEDFYADLDPAARQETPRRVESDIHHQKKDVMSTIMEYQAPALTVDSSDVHAENQAWFVVPLAMVAWFGGMWAWCKAVCWGNGGVKSCETRYVVNVKAVCWR